MLIGKPEHFATRRQVLAGSGALATAGLAGCLDFLDDDPDPDPDLVPVHGLLLEGSLYIPPIVHGRDIGLFEEAGIDFTFRIVGFGEFTRQFTAELTEGFSTLSALVVMEQLGTGEPIRAFGQTMNLFNQCFVRDDSPFESPSDLVGHTLGVPGMGSSTTRSYIAQWIEELGIDLRDEFELVDAPSGALLDFLRQDEEVDATILFTSQTIAAEADPDLRSVYNPTPGWIDVTGYPPAVNLWGVFDDFLSEHPEQVIAFQEAWWEAVEELRADYEPIMQEYAPLGGLDVGAPEELDVVRRWVTEDQIAFNTEWHDDFVESNLQAAEAVHAVGGIEAAPSREHFVTHDDIRDDWM